MRLTKKKWHQLCGRKKDWFEYIPNKYTSHDRIYKLGQLEDMEDELGIDLTTLFKALKDGIYGKVGKKIEHILAPHLSWHYSEIYIFKIKDYGKTWALKKKELKHEIY